MEFLQSYWIWILLGIGAVWFLARRGAHGMGCGMGGHEAHNSPGGREEPGRGASTGGVGEHAGHASGRRDGAGSRRHGCC